MNELSNTEDGAGSAAGRNGPFLPKEKFIKSSLWDCFFPNSTSPFLSPFQAHSHQEYQEGVSKEALVVHRKKNSTKITNFGYLQVLILPLQENSGILTDIPTENEILGIYRGISEEIPRKHKIGFPQNFLGIYRRNSEETTVRRNIPRKFRGKLCSSEKTDEFRGNIIAVGGFYKIPRKFRRTSFVRRNSVGISSVCRQDLNYKYKHSSSSSFTSYLRPPSYSIYTRI
ncbi:hypothetical protein YC2023_049988 [Brassica napus]